MNDEPLFSGRVPSEALLRCWQEGIDEFNRGAFWEAHHHWEEGWNRLPFPEKQRIQHLIAACAVQVHLSKGKAGSALSLCRLALKRLDDLKQSPPALDVWIEIPGLEEVLRKAEPILESGLDARDILEQFNDLKGCLCRI